MSDAGITRRFFLKIVGATSVAASCSPSHAPEKLVPLLNPPENMVPGKPLFYRTVCRACDAGCGVTARSREGRVVKLEGNPEDPISGGALCARGQGELQELYSPSRLRGPLVRRGATLAGAPWSEALQGVQDALSKLRGPDGRIAGLRMLSRWEPGSAGAVQKAFVAALGTSPAQRVVFEPRDLSALRAANAALFGAPELPVLDLARARAVVSFGADFLETWLSPVEQARAFMATRSHPDRPRLTWVGPRLPMSGANADTWLRVRPGGELPVAIALLRFLLDPANRVAQLPPEAAAIRAALPRLALPEGVSSQQIARLGRELDARRPSALLGPGAVSTGPAANALAVAIQLANHVLGNLGRTVLLGLGSEEDAPSPESELRALLDEARRGEVKVLLVHRRDPLGELPASARVEEALRRIPLIVAFGEQLDATARLAHFVLPDHHALESFGDLQPRRGVLQLQQPALTPLWDTKAAPQVLLDLAAALALPGIADKDFHELSKTRWQAAAKQLGATLDTPQAQRNLIARGSVAGKVEPAKRPLRLGRLGALLQAPPSPATGLQLVAFATPLRNADPNAPSWLREIPDALSGVSWSSWAELSPATAARLGVRPGDLLALSTAAGAVELPAAINPALHDGAVAVPSNAPELRALSATGVDVQVQRTGRTFPIAITGRASQEGRGLAKATDKNGHLERAREHEHEYGQAGQPEGARPTPPATLIPPHKHEGRRWAMSVDLDRCTGCQACVVACYAENNVPVVGPEHARDGRLMAWLRIQRSFEPSVDSTREPVPPPDDRTRIAVLPSLCQQCDAAPCEPVCPVYATYHTAEGLNAQVYNRCIGTRYCANNCPYDARVFNWKDHPLEEPLQMQLNPDVSMRSKGIMEKCTFCVQRIRFAEGVAKDEHRPVADGEVLPACVQTCPAQALVFGDANDPHARVNEARLDPRAYTLLEEANTLPAIAYLARRTGDAS